MTYDQADYFRIPLLDGSFGVGQVFETPAGVAETMFCGISTRRATDQDVIAPFSLSEIIALVRTSDDPLTTGTWPLAGFDQIPRFRDVYNYDGAAALGFPDKPLHDTAVIEAFTNAVHGLYPWDAFGDLFHQLKRVDVDKP